MIVRRDGLVKVLDFGLAKLVPSAAAPHGATESLRPPSRARSSAPRTTCRPSRRAARTWTRAPILGARRGALRDGRRAAAVRGRDQGDVQAAVLQGEPAPLTRADAAVPPELQRIVDKALRKDPERRYQVMKDLLLDLEALRDRASPHERPDGASARTTHRGGGWPGASPCRGGSRRSRHRVDGRARARSPPARAPRRCHPAGEHPARDGRHAAGDRRAGRAVAGRHPAGVRRPPSGARAPSLRAASRPAQRHAPQRHGGGRDALLLPGRTVDRLLRRREAEEGARRRAAPS